MVRFGRIKKKTKAEPAQDESQQEQLPSGHVHNADPDSVVSSPRPDPPLPPVPRVALPHVDTFLNMHQHNGLFDVGSTDEHNGSTGVAAATATATDCSTLSTGGCRLGLLH